MIDTTLDYFSLLKFIAHNLAQNADQLKTKHKIQPSQFTSTNDTYK